MPELPEVEVVRLGIETAVTDALVTEVEVLDSRSLRRHPGPPEDFIQRLTGARLAAPERRGKFLWLPLGETGEALVVHLGMSGQVLLREPTVQDARTRIRIDIAGVAGDLRLNFVDQRIFGSMAMDDLVPTPDVEGGWVPSSVAHISRDPLDAHFDDRRFLARLAAKRTGVKRALLDQQLVSGVGNIYADEALWLARLHYDQPSNTVSRPKARALLAAVRDVFTKALVEGGTSFDTQYVNVNGESGYFAHSLNAYGQHGRPCPRCGTLIVREQWMNRNSHFCPRCQRLRATK